MYKGLAVLNGSIIAFMVMVNGMLASEVGQYISLIIIHIVGLISVVLFFIINKKKVVSLKNIPPVLFSAGAIGILNVYFNNICFPKLGVTITLTLGLLGQLITACIIDHYGLLGMDTHRFGLEKIAPLGLISMGIIAMIAI